MTQDEALTILGVTSSASDKEVSDAYRALAEIYHPDRYGSASAKAREEAARRMSRVTEAYDVVKRGRSGAAESSGESYSSGTSSGPSPSGGRGTRASQTSSSSVLNSRGGGVKVVPILVLVIAVLGGFFLVWSVLDGDGGRFEGAEDLYDALGCTRFSTGGGDISEDSDAEGYSVEYSGCRLENGLLITFGVWEEDGRIDSFLDMQRKQCLDPANSEFSFCGFFTVGPNWYVGSHTRAEAEHVQDIVGGTIREVSRR